jgi:diguanylate cyclase (GGDEF)-like protein
MQFLYIHHLFYLMRLQTKLDFVTVGTLVVAILSVLLIGSVLVQKRTSALQQQMFYLELENTITTILYLEGKPASGQLFSYFREAQHFFVARLGVTPAVLDYGGIERDQVDALIRTTETFDQTSGEFTYKVHDIPFLGIYKKLPERNNLIIAIGMSKSQYSNHWQPFVKYMIFPLLLIFGAWFALQAYLHRRLSSQLIKTNIALRALHENYYNAQINPLSDYTELAEIQNSINRLVLKLQSKEQDFLEMEEANVLETRHREKAELSLRNRLVELERVKNDNQHSLNRLQYLAQHDDLTGLCNRRSLQEELIKITSRASRHETEHALLFFDLDEFKYINDMYGHSTGDHVLTNCAAELVQVLNDKNTLFSRIGGDEFAVLLINTNKATTKSVADKILHCISRIPFQVQGKILRLTASLGVAFYPEHAVDAESLLAHADAAMYQAKTAGKNIWQVYSPDRNTAAQKIDDFSWGKKIEQALDHDLFKLYFQGIHQAKDKSLSHLEILIRMKDITNPEKIITPDRFIPHAERSGLILDIDRFVLKESINLLARSKRIPPLAVNISGRSIEDPTLSYFIIKELEQQNVEPWRLLVELTETAAVADLHDAQNFIDVLSKMGCRICLDDFGVGFSSFGYLKHLKVDTVKIDGLFIRDLIHDKDNQAFVKAIIDVAKSMDKETIAEFVENEETLLMLNSFGIDLVQGYYLSKPVSYHPSFQGVPIGNSKFSHKYSEHRL